MNIDHTIQQIKEVYAKGENIISHLKKMENRTENTLEDILISYDFQAGNYSMAYDQNPEIYKAFHEEMAEILNRYLTDGRSSLLEAGVGEATSMAPVINSIVKKPKHVYGIDISWSRLKYARKHMEDICTYNGPMDLFVGNLFQIPLKDDSIDIVYTVHSVEPNGGKAKELIKELYRIAGRYVILFEPAYEFASSEARERMKQNGYVTNLKETVDNLGYNILTYQLLGATLNPLNPTGVMVIEKSKVEREASGESPFCCPISKGDLIEAKGAMFCKESLLAYPVLDGIPCLTEQNAVLATKFLEV